MGPSKGPWLLRFLIIDKDIDSKLYLTGHGALSDEPVTIVPKGAKWQMVRIFKH